MVSIGNDEVVAWKFPLATPSLVLSLLIAAFLALLGVVWADLPQLASSPILQQLSLPLPATCAAGFVHHLDADPCYAPSLQIKIHGCGCKSGPGGEHVAEPSVTYVIPPVEAHVVELTAAQLRDEVIFTFVHLNKAGGSTVKRALYHMLEEHRWDGAGYGTFPGWQALGRPFESPLSPSGGVQHAQRSRRRRLKRSTGPREFIYPLYVSCGKPIPRELDAVPLRPAVAFSVPPPPPPPPLSRHSSGKCALRAVWGAKAMGLCDHFPGRPCVYFTVLRDPVERAVSEYNYFCVRGAEGRHKWTAEWKRRGRCEATLAEYFRVHAHLSSPMALIEHLTRGCDEECGVTAAIANLEHPCLRFLLLDRLGDGYARLRTAFGPAFGDSLDAVLGGTKGDRNNATDVRLGSEAEGIGGLVVPKVNARAKYEARTQRYVANLTEMALLRSLLAPDILLFEHAVRYYEAQWARPLTACPSSFL